MADIVINEISQNYSYVIGDSSYCCVALPITASWGPAYKGYVESEDDSITKDDALEDVVWSRFRANSQGLESFVSTYRGPASNYRLSQDFSYQMAVSLLTAGYDVLVCRLCPGTEATSMLRRSYPGEISDDWFKSVDSNGNLDLPIWKDASSKETLTTIPFEVNSEHPIVVTSTNPNFQGANIVIASNPVTLDQPTGVYAIKSAEMLSGSIEYSEPKQGDEYTLVFESPQYFDSVTSVVYVSPTSGNDPATRTPLVLNTDYSVSDSGTIKLLSVSTDPVIPAVAEAGSKIEISYTCKKYLANTIDKFIFHIKGEDSKDPLKWASYGIQTKDEITYTGDKALETIDGKKGTLSITAKYPGTFGNRLQCTLRRMSTVGVNYWNLVVYVVDASGVRVAVENLNFVFDIDDSTDTILYWEEIESQFIDMVADNLDESSKFTESPGEIQEDKLTIVFSSGKDKVNFTNVKTSLSNAIDYAATRFNTAIFEITDEDSIDVTDDGSEGKKIERGAQFTVEHSRMQKVSLVQFKATGESTQWVSLVPNEDYKVLPITLADTRTIELLSSSTKIPEDSAVGSSLKITYSYIESVGGTDKKDSNITYVKAMCNKFNEYLSDSSTMDDTTAATWEYLEWLFTQSLDIYGLLDDRLAYNPNRIISPGWDDQDFLRVTGESKYTANITTPSPIHIKLMEAAYYSRCATAYIDLPKSIAKKHVYNDSQQQDIRGYAQLLARQELADSDGLFTTHSALFGPWGTYMYIGTSKQQTASPSFLALLIQRSMILNQSLQYEWVQPSSRKNKVNIGKMDYTVSKKYLDLWQPDPDTSGGVGVNAIANIPALGLSIWGDSTLYENPPATYQALRNLSTRLLVNAIKDVVYKVGISITFQYTNQTAFSSFYVGVTPILDSMVNAGAIGDYKVVIGNDLDALGMVKANSCVGKIYITPNGTIQHITVDLIALPPQTDLSNYN